MTRPRNVGLIQHNGAIVPGVRLPAAILDQPTYDRIVALYVSRRRGRQPSGRYVLTGIASCGECGASLSGRPVASTGRRHYWCKPTGHVSVDADRLDDWAGDFAVRELGNVSQAEALERESAEREAQRQSLLAETLAIEQTLMEIGSRLGRQEITLQRHDAICKPLEARQAAIRAELAALAIAEPEPIPSGLRRIEARDEAHLDWLIRWDEGSPAERRAMVLRALNGRRLVVSRALKDGRLMVGRDTRFDPERVRIA